MEMTVFARKMQKAMTEVLGEDYEVKLQEVQKNNGVLLQGILILTKQQNVSPTIYLEPFWEAYEGGVTMAELVRKILQIYREDAPKTSVDMSFFRDFDRVKDRICYRLIHAQKNAALLEKIPHIPFLDLCLCFYYAYDGNELGSGSILIYNTHVNMWQSSTEELMRLARCNTPRLFPWEQSSMEEVVKEVMKEQECKAGEKRLGEEEKQQFLVEVSMKILSNRQKIHGAVCILYPNLLEEIACKEGCNLFILPSSVHEVILLPDHGREDRKQLRAMIAEVNATQLEPEEVLSDSLYYYDQKEKCVKIV